MAKVTDLARYKKIRNQRKVRVELSILTFLAPYGGLLAVIAVAFGVWGVLGYGLTGLPWTVEGFMDGWSSTWRRWSFLPLKRFDFFLLIWFLLVLISSTIGVRALCVAPSCVRAARLFNSAFTQEQIEKAFPSAAFWVIRCTKQGFWVAPLWVDVQGLELKMTTRGKMSGYWFRYGSAESLADALSRVGFAVYVIEHDGTIDSSSKWEV